MIKPEIPIHEMERLQALNEYNILDTLPETEYDEITKIASYICGTPISTITLIDEHRQYFKSHRGVHNSETPRDYAFCAHAINKPQQMTIVEDSRLDERFFDNPLVTGDPNVIFYAGMPLVNPDGYALGTLCVIDNKPRKISAEQTEIMEALGKQVVKLLELRKTNQQLIHSRKKLENYSEQMKSFAYMASHDLKEPARMVISFLKLFVNKYGETMEEKGKEYVHYAADGAKRMSILIDELLAYSLADNSTGIHEMVNIEELVKEVIALQQGVIREKQAEIQVGKMPEIFAMKTSVKIVFQNLIANALKYHSEGTQPRIHISGSDHKHQWQFAIKDNGIGIDQQNLETIFQMFKRLHSRSEYSGTGIGLATCKQIIEKYSGEIWVESERGSGSTFYFTIPKKRKHEDNSHLADRG